jgi:hypothetical protein
VASVVSQNRAQDHERNLLAAAHAVASWARARRATWTDVPLEIPSAPAPAVTPALPVPPARAAQPGPSAVPARELFSHLSASPAETVEDSGPSRWSSVVDRLRVMRPSVVRWLPYAAIVAVVGVLLGLVAPYVFRTADNVKTRIAAITPERTRPPEPIRASAAGKLSVTSTPVGATVLIDGKSRGVTPLTIAGLTPGRHEVLIKSDAGSVRRTVTVSTKDATEVNEAIFSGWVAIYPPFDVVISEGGEVLQPDGRNQIMLPPGMHGLQITNRALGYAVVQQVEVFPGAGTDLRLPMPSSTITITASEPAEVWLDGVRISDTPMSAVPVPLGAHEVVVKRQAGGEKRFPVTIGAKPFTLNVDFP